MKFRFSTTYFFLSALCTGAHTEVTNLVLKLWLPQMLRNILKFDKWLTNKLLLPPGEGNVSMNYVQFQPFSHYFVYLFIFNSATDYLHLWPHWPCALEQRITFVWRITISHWTNSRALLLQIVTFHFSASDSIIRNALSEYLLIIFPTIFNT